MSLCKKCKSAPNNAPEKPEGLEENEICDRCGFDPATEIDRKARVAKVIVSKEYFNPAHLFKEGHKITNGLPEDAEFVKFKNYPMLDAYVFLFRSREFKPIDELTMLEDIPEVDIEITEVE